MTADQDGDDVVGPAKITPLHVRGRPSTNDDFRVILGKEAWKLNTILEALFDKDKLGAKDSPATLDRLDAGRFYSKLYWLLEPHGRDSTQALNGGRGGGFGLPISMMQQEAGRALADIEDHLGAKDKIMLKCVCKDNMLPHEGARLADCDPAIRVHPRFRDALDELVGAIRISGGASPARFNALRRDL